MKPIILHADLMGSLQPTGIETFLRRLVQGLLKYSSGHFQYWVWKQGKIFLLGEGDHDLFIKSIRANWSYFFPLWEYALWTKLPAELRHAPVFEPHYFIHQARNPTVSYIHDLSCIDRAWDHPWYRVLKHKLYLPVVLKKTVAVMVHTQFIRDRILYHWPCVDPQKIFVIPGGIDREEMVASKFFERKNSILILSTQEPRKGIAEVLTTLNHFLNKHVSWEVWIVGKIGWKVKKFMVHPRIKWFGYVSQNQLKQLLGECGVLLYPSFYEGFGLPVLEALSVGCPCVIRDIPALSEWVPRDVPKFCIADDLMTLLEKGMSEGFRISEFPQNFLLKHSTQRFEECLDQVLSRA